MTNVDRRDVRLESGVRKMLLYFLLVLVGSGERRLLEINQTLLLSDSNLAFSKKFERHLTF